MNRKNRFTFSTVIVKIKVAPFMVHAVWVSLICSYHVFMLCVNEWCIQLDVSVPNIFWTIVLDLRNFIQLIGWL